MSIEVKQINIYGKMRLNVHIVIAKAALKPSVLGRHVRLHRNNIRPLSAISVIQVIYSGTSDHSDRRSQPILDVVFLAYERKYSKGMLEGCNRNAIARNRFNLRDRLRSASKAEMV